MNDKTKDLKDSKEVKKFNKKLSVNFLRNSISESDKEKKEKKEYAKEKEHKEKDSKDRDKEKKKDKEREKKEKDHKKDKKSGKNNDLIGKIQSGNILNRSKEKLTSKDESSKRKSSGSGLRKSKTRKMPSTSAINEQWKVLMDAIKLPESQRKDMETLSIESKWIFIKINEQNLAALNDDKGEIKGSVVYYINFLQGNNSIVVEDIKSLRLAITTQPAIWSKNFREGNGVYILSKILEQTNDRKKYSTTCTELQSEIVKAIQALLIPDINATSQPILQEFATSSTALEVIKRLILVTASPEPKNRKIAYDLLISIIDVTDDNIDAHRKVLEGFDYLKYIYGESLRFELLVETLRFESNSEVVASALVLVNALINTPESLDQRIYIRNEFFSLGFEDVLENLKKSANSNDINHQIKGFEKDRNLDNDEFSDRISTRKKVVDLKNPTDLVSALLEMVKNKKYLHTAFLETIKNLLSMPVDKERGLKLWYVIDKIVHQVSMLKDEIEINERNPIDMEELLAAVEDKEALDILREKSFTEKQRFELKIDSLKEEIQEARQHNIRIQDEMNEKLEYEISKAKAKFDETLEEAINTRLAESKKQMNQNEEMLQKRIEELIENERSLILDIEEVRKDREVLKEDLYNKSRRIEVAEEQMAEFKEQIEQFEEDRKKYNTELASLKSDLNAKEAEFENYKVSRESEFQTALYNKVQEAEISHSNILEKIRKEYEEEIESVRKSTQELVSKKYEAELVGVQAAADERVQAALSDLKKLKVATHLRDSKSNADEELKKIESKINDDYENRLMRSASMLKSRIQDVDRLEKCLSEEKNKVERINRQYSEMRQKYDDLNTSWMQAIAKHTATIKEFNEERQGLISNIKCLTDEKKVLEEQIHQVQTRYKFKKEGLLKRHLTEIKKEKDKNMEMQSKSETDKNLIVQKYEAKIDILSNQLKILKNEIFTKSKDFDEERIKLRKLLDEKELEIESKEKEWQENVKERTKLLEIEKLKIERTLELAKRGHEAEMNDLSGKMNEYIQAREKIAEQMVELREKYTELQHEHEDTVKELKSMQGRLMASTQYQVATSSNTLIEQINELKEENEKLNERIDDLEQAKDSLNERATEVTSGMIMRQLEESKKRIFELDEELQDTRAQLYEAKRSKLDIQAKHKDQAAEIMFQTSSGSSVELELYAKKLELTEGKLQKIGEENQVLNKTVDNLGEVIESLKTENQSMLSMKESNDNLIKGLQDELKKQAVQISELERQECGDDLQSARVNELSEKNLSLTNSLHEKIQSNSELQNNELRLKESIEVLINQNRVLLSQVDDLKKERKIVETNFENLTQDSEVLNSSFNRLTEELNLVKQKYEESFNRANEQEEKNTELNKKINDLISNQNENLELKKKLEESKSEITRLVDQLESLKSELAQNELTEQLDQSKTKSIEPENKTELKSSKDSAQILDRPSDTPKSNLSEGSASETIERLENIISNLKNENALLQKKINTEKSASNPEDTSGEISEIAVTETKSSVVEVTNTDSPPPPPPPPPPGAGAPPPPPPTSNIASKKIPQGPKPKIPMRNFQWSKLTQNQVAKTLFNELDFSKVELDTDTLESLFGSKVVEKASTPVKEPKFVRETLFSSIEPRRLQNVGIFLQTCKIGTQELIDAIFMLDDGLLNSEMIKKVIEVFPTPEEIKSIKAYIDNGGLPEKMENVDKFFLELTVIPQASTRLQCFEFKLNFPQKILEIKPALLRVKKANIDFSKNQAHFLDLLQIILAIGNFLNNGTSRGSALGFQLNSLSKLAETKSTDNSMNLLEYLVDYLEKHRPDIVDWPAEIKDLNFVMKVVWAQVLDDILAMKKSLSQTQALAETVKKSDNKWDAFHGVIPNSLKQYSKDFAEVEELLEKVSSDYKEIVSKYGVAPDVPPEEFYGMVVNFSVQYDRARKEAKIRKVKEEKNARKKALEEVQERLAKEKLERGKNKSIREKTPANAGGNRRELVRDSVNLQKIEISNTDKDETEILKDITGIRTDQVAERRRLRRQNTLREKRQQIKALND